MSERLEPSTLCAGCPTALPTGELARLLARGYGQMVTEHDPDGLQHLQRTALVGLVASSYIHDLNNLLTLIIGGIAVVADELPESDPNRDRIQAVQRAGESAAALAQRLMAFVRRRPPEPCSTSLSQLVEECLPLLARLLNQQLLVSSKLGPELWPVRADRVQLEQVLLNLLINARDAMPEGGEVTLSAANVEAGPAEGVPPGEYVRLSVIDTGPGLSPELMERLFTPFVTAGPRGVGLGLFSCYLVVHELGGAIQVESAPGRGTTFQIYLPRAEG